MVHDAPQEYYLTQLEQKIGVAAVKDLSVSELGRHMAVMQLTGMERFVEAHYHKQAAAARENNVGRSRPKTAKGGGQKKRYISGRR